MLTFQDFEESKGDIPAFIAKAIQEHKASDRYIKAMTDREYYKTKNPYALSRMTYLERFAPQTLKVKFHKVTTGYFRMGVQKQTNYLLGNGLTLDRELLNQIDTEFDSKFRKAAIAAKVDSVVYLYPLKDKPIVSVFKLHEYIELLDERTGEPKAGIRFTQLTPEKPVYVELYELDGVTEYKGDKGGKDFVLLTAKVPYKYEQKKDIIETKITSIENYNEFPIITLYANDDHIGELTEALRSAIDAYDAISGDLSDGITLIEGVYGIVKNFMGENQDELMSQIREFKTIVLNGEEGDASATMQAIEVPFQAKKVALDFFRDRIFEELMIPDKRKTGRAVTAKEIMSDNDDMDSKADEFELEIEPAIEKLFRLKGIKENFTPYKRRTAINDTETITNINDCVTAGTMTKRMAVILNPIIPEDMKDEEIAALEVQQQTEAEETFPLGGENEVTTDVTATDVTAQAEEVASKTLSGIQTQSLMAVIKQLAEGSLTLGQAVNIVSVSIGVTKEKAKEIIEGLD